ncbi:unnamed protein product, partial [marine sediment metagenome]
VLTARHCVRNFAVTCEFFLGSEFAVAAKGRVVAVSRNRDLAAVLIPASEFAGRFPSAVPVADMPPEIGAKIHTIGCPRGAKPTALAGQVLGYPSPRDMTFSPAPVSGRSGSAIFDAEGDEIVGILTKRRWTGGMPVHGLAESTTAIDGFFGTSRASAVEATEEATEEAWWWPGKLMIRGRRGGGCGPGGCGPDGCPGQDGMPGGGIGDIAPSPDWEGPGLPDDEIEVPDPTFDPVPPVVDPPAAPIADPPNTDVADLQEQIDALQEQIAALASIPGTQGPQGPPGPPGAPAEPVDVDAIVAAIVAQLQPDPNQQAIPAYYRITPRN